MLHAFETRKKIEREKTNSFLTSDFSPLLTSVFCSRNLQKSDSSLFVHSEDFLHTGSAFPETVDTCKYRKSSVNPLGAYYGGGGGLTELLRYV